LLTGVAAAEVAFRWTGHGSSAAVAFSDVSADGCVETTGQLVITAAPGLPGPQGIILGSSTDHCNLNEDGEPTSSFFFGGGEVTYSSNGLASATASGTVIATSFFGGDPITFEFDLAFSGSGPVRTTTNRFISTAGGVTLFFNAQRQRFATVTGSFTIDGETATLSDAQLFSETAGELVILNQ
jgi:hypothetical protein